MTQLIQDQKDFDGWHKGEMKKYGVVLFRLSVAPLMNVVERLVAPKWNGATFLEDQAVTGGLEDLEFDWVLDFTFSSQEYGENKQ